VITLKKTILRAPSHLSAEARAWWREIVTDFAIDDRAGLLLLTQAAEAWDRARDCRQAIERDGVTVRDRFDQVRPHPLLPAERDARAAFLQAVKHLHLDIAIPEPRHARH
jgi:P27 family predicted phage terminase small subunit